MMLIMLFAALYYETRLLVSPNARPSRTHSHVPCAVGNNGFALFSSDAQLCAAKERRAHIARMWRSACAWSTRAKSLSDSTTYNRQHFLSDAQIKRARSRSGLAPLRVWTALFHSMLRCSATCTALDAAAASRVKCQSSSSSSTYAI